MELRGVMMKLYFLLVILMIGFVSAGTMICIDLDAPSAPSNLTVSGKVGNIFLTWGEATDDPSCSGIEEYVISREGFEIGRVEGEVLNFTDSNDSLGVGEYSYTVYAVDKVGHNTGSAVINIVSIENGDDGNVVQSSGGSSGGSSICAEDWSCGNWSECVGNGQRRLCDDLRKCGTENYKPEVYRECGVEEDLGNIINVEHSSESGNVEGFFSTVTGAVVGAAGTTGGAVVSAFILLALGGLIVIRFRKKDNK